MGSGVEVIRLENVSKKFVLRKDKSLKEHLVNFQRSRKHREDFFALDHIDAKIEAGSTVGLIGHNGSGKSTLLKIIGGIIEPSTGSVSRRGRMAALLELGAGFHPDLTGRENVYLNASILGLSRAETRQHFDEIVDFSGIGEFIDTQVKFYSSGMYVRLAFSVAVHIDPDLLLVDEVLAVGDEPFQRKCMDKVAQFQREGRTIILVSHSAEQIGRVCDRVLLLRSGKLVYDGNAPEGLRQLRQGFQEERLKEIDRIRSLPADDPRRAGVGLDSELPPAMMHDVTFRTSPQTDSGAAPAGATLTFSVDCELFDDEQYDVGIAIETAAGMPVYQISLSDLDESISGAGHRTVDFTIPDNPLANGQYVVSAAIARNRGEVVGGINPALWFDVDHPITGRGVIAVNPSVEIAESRQQP